MVLLAVSFPSLKLPEQGIRSCGGILTYALSWSLWLLGSLCDRVVNPCVEEVTVLVTCLVKEIQLYLTICSVPCGAQRC